MMRDSDWRIVWNPLGASPRVLLDYDDLMEEETARALEQLVDIGRFDFAASGQPASRGNLRQRLEFSRRDAHATAAQSWDACQAALAEDPWGMKSLVQVVPRGGTPRLHSAALLSSNHQPATDGPEPESVHHYAFRVAPQWMLSLGSGIAVIGGYYNGPNTIIIVIPEGEGEDIEPGDTVLVDGVPGVPGGYYPVVSGGGSGTLGLGTPKGKAPPAPLSKVEFTSLFPVSPSIVSGEFRHHAYLYRSFKFTAAVSYQYHDGSTWNTVAPGIFTQRYPTNSDSIILPGLSPGAWTGLSDSDTPKPVAFEFQTGRFTWRRIGGDTQTIYVPIAADGEVSYSAGNGSINRLNLPEMTAELTAESNYIPPDNQIAGGGTITKAEPSDTEP